MTVNEAIAAAVQYVGDQVPREYMVGWLSEIENTVVTEIAATHSGLDWDSTVITQETDGEKSLFAPDPYSKLYTAYLVMKSDIYLRDVSGYVNSASVFLESYNSFSDWYNRTFMPLSRERIKL